MTNDDPALRSAFYAPCLEDFIAAAAEGRNVASTSPAAVAGLVAHITNVERLNVERRAEDAATIAALQAEVAALRSTLCVLRSALRRFAVPGHCDVTRRGVGQCGGACRWCEANKALERLSD